MSSISYDLAVIGAGPGGYVAAIRASQLGLKTVLIDKNVSLGGTCLRVGCIPSKALLTSSEHFYFAKHQALEHGLLLKEVGVDLAAMMKRKEQVVSQLAKGISFLMKKHKVDVVQGAGKLQDAQTVHLTALDGKTSTLSAKKILLATGSIPIELPFLKLDGKQVISSDHAIALSSIPKSMLVIGGGAIGLELGSVWSRLGTRVEIIELQSQIAFGFDNELSAGLQKAMEKQGVVFHLKTKVESGQVEGKKVKLTVLQENQKKTLEGDVVLVAIGRRPYHEGLGLKEVGVALSEGGRVQVSSQWQTSVPSIYAIGDVIDGPMLAHKAEAEGSAVAEVLAGKPGFVNYNIIPGIIYTDPEVASVGLSEEEARNKNLRYKIGKSPFIANGRALAGGTAEGFVKVMADAKTDRILGLHILSINASELIAEATALMEFSASAEDLARTIHGHPTMSEALKEAAHAAWHAS